MSLNGFLLIDKPLNITSFDVVQKIRKIVGTKKVGHTGTLDPLASGLMVILLNEATKLSDYILSGDKGYEVEITFGVNTTTWDAEGDIVSSFQKKIALKDLLDEAQKMIGALNIEVPIYSAIKIDGDRLYKKAREGVEIKAPLREMQFHKVEFLAVTEGSQQDVKKAKFKILCAKGGYIRSWAFELGKRLQSGAYVSELRRVFSAPYSVDEAVTLEQLKDVNWQNTESVRSYKFFKNISQIDVVTQKISLGLFEARLMKNGLIPKGLLDDGGLKSAGIYSFFEGETLIAVAEFIEKPGGGFETSRFRVLNT